jgi:TP901 family phage tail tape measure protein
MSATTVARINTIVTANTTQFTAAMGKAQTRAGKFAAAAGAAAKAASGPLTMGLLAVGGAAVKAAIDFDDSMSKIESLVGIAGDEVDAMKESVRALAGQTAQAPTKLADAMFFIQSAGLRGATAMETLEASAKAAAVGLGEVDQIADLATSALNAYGAENLSATDATDVLTAAVREGKLEASELSGAMGQTLPVASAMGVRFDEVGAAFAAMSRTGTGASEAATQLRGILSTLLRPSKQAEDALKDMGMSSAGLRQQIKDEGLLDVLQTLVGAFDGNAAATAAVFGNVRALTGVLDLMGAGAETTEAIFASMEETTGTLNDAFAITSETAGFKFRQAMADAQEALVGIGQQLLPIATTLLEGIKTIVSVFQDLPGPVKAAAAAMAAFVVASGPIGATALAVGGLLYAFGQLGEESNRAADRQEALTAEFVAAGDPAATMIDRMTELAASIEDVADEADGAVDPVNELVGSNLALGMAVDKEVLPFFDDLGISMDDVARVAESGTDEFEKLQDVLDNTSSANSMRTSIENLTGAERQLAESLIDAYEAGDLKDKQLRDMLDVVDESADAFDDNRKALEEQSQAFIESADAVKLLNDAGRNGEAVLAAWQRAGLSYTQMAKHIDSIVTESTDAFGEYNVEAELAAINTRDLATEAGDAEQPLEDAEVKVKGVASAMNNAATEAQTLQEAFEDLMGSIVFEGEALNNTQLLMAEFDDVLAAIADETVPELRDSFYDMAQTAAGQLGQLADAGIELGSAEMAGAADAFLADLAAMADAAAIPGDELAHIQRTLLEMSGQVIPFTLRVKTERLPGFIPAVGTGVGFIGATGGIVTRPTMALIGEAGPEAVVPLSSAPGASPLPSGGVMGGGDTHITINMPTGANGDDVVRALQDYTRRRGAIPVPVGTARY